MIPFVMQAASLTVKARLYLAQPSATAFLVRVFSHENSRPRETGRSITMWRSSGSTTDGSGVDLANVKMSMNPFDEIAVEEALRLKEKARPVK